MKPAWRAAIATLRFCSALLTCVLVSSCAPTSDSVGGVQLDSSAVAAAALAALDADSTGDLDPKELQASPGLAHVVSMSDRDGNGQLSREELSERLAAHASAGPVDYVFEVFYRGQPAVGATVKLVPAAFYGDALPTAEAEVDASGLCRPTSQGAERGVWMGIYRVAVQSPKLNLPEKYNTQSQLEIEVVRGGHLTREGRPPRLELD
jgi:hypothetical protein